MEKTLVEVFSIFFVCGKADCCKQRERHHISAIPSDVIEFLSF